MNDETQFQDRDFVLLKSDGDVPMMAGCMRCGCKFFTPSTFKDDAYVAGLYLASKFTEHTCLIKKAKKSGGVGGKKVVSELRSAEGPTL
jgi:predicted  nucleic acid-binding Zn-ribbon protein